MDDSLGLDLSKLSLEIKKPIAEPKALAPPGTVCEICNSKEEGETFPLERCPHCSATPCHHHIKCCPCSPEAKAEAARNANPETMAKARAAAELARLDKPTSLRKLVLRPAQPQQRRPLVLLTLPIHQLLKPHTRKQ